MSDCGNCTADLKRANGCVGPPTNRDGTTHPWRFPPGAQKPEAEIDRCPGRLLFNATDVMDMFCTLGRCGDSIAIDSQLELPQPYLDALGLGERHRALRMAKKLKEDQFKEQQKHAAKTGGHRGRR